LSQTLIGYARVSTFDQVLDLQMDALQKAGCAKIFTDTITGSKAERPGLTAALAYLRPGDVLVVWRLDRLGRSMQHLTQCVADLETRGVEFRSLQEAIDTTTSSGRLMFHFMGALAEFERDLIKERTNAGLAAARARGRKGGRPAAMTAEQVQMARILRADPTQSVQAICRAMGVSRATLYRYTS
jgi:DNA invertase Pin-like site-specific DNA recombinase